MALPAPNLDDRRFQHLVDEAKRFIAQRCPEWTDHNVSDPGVTLIEAFAHMVDQLLYRLNRVPERTYLAFLDLIGVTLFPPTAARADVTFWLSGPQPEPVVLRAGTEVATVRTETEEAVVFATTADRTVPPCALSALRGRPAAGPAADLTDAVGAGRDARCFADPPAVGDALLVGLTTAVPGCAVVLRLDSRVEGIGVDPRQPPLRWQAWTGRDWADCAVDSDGTGGLNRPGDVVLHVPTGHVASRVEDRRAGWLRCVVVEAEPGQPGYTASPTVRAAEAFTIGGTVDAVHAETVTHELLGESEGVPGQRWRVARPPVLPDDVPFVVEVAGDDGWREWPEVPGFADADPAARAVTLDRSTGEVAFPPAVREPDGTLRHYGAVPPAGAALRVRRYRTGGGRAGNVARGALRTLRSAVPAVSRVTNREAARGGVDGETVEAAKHRGPVELRAQDRAVTARDYELLAARAAPAAARLRCLPADEESGVRLLVVPGATADAGDRLRFTQLIPPADLLAAIAGYLDARRPLGVRLVVEPPYYQGVTVVARLTARSGADPAALAAAALDALYAHLNPLTGGPDGAGWEFGRPVQAGEVFAVLHALPGLALVEEVLLFPADPVTGTRGAPATRIDLDRHALVFSYEHQVRVELP
ncbi:putative baseplate assembly protein [Pilimelia anulata]|uniref:Putative baseplate assembly protein n=1 Tax=Pilimelia anulata TaxID=53371 RepID=A0A8J3FCU0_9ACTN|nr:putative baseplate assembly protein [Pilimelia anulata]GGK10013.1 putative baseplate assembly protein [Pilimelia anulata]